MVQRNITLSVDEDTVHLLNQLKLATNHTKSRITRRAVKLLAMTEHGGRVVDPLKVRFLEAAFESLREAVEYEVTREDVESHSPRMVAWGAKAQAILGAVYGFPSDSEDEE